MNGWKLTVVESYADMSRLAADIVQHSIEHRPGCAISLPTGETPRGMYQELVRRAQDGTIGWAHTRFFCLDDYLGRGKDDPFSLTGWLERTFLQPAKFPEGQTHLIPTTAANPHDAAIDYERQLASAGGLELIVLGLGANGHIGFNEPGSAIDSRTRVIDLTAESRESNAQYYEGDATIPGQAMSMGVGTILEARRIVLIVSGESKAGIVQRALEGPVGPDVPASFLQTVSAKLEVIIDHPAASRLGTSQQPRT